ncbi:MAG: DUF4235 domain-containing protein [Bifidobacterium sp.]|nr:DUF4235 domain-containing protein [Bifidobacterium sp.]
MSTRSKKHAGAKAKEPKLEAEVKADAKDGAAKGMDLDATTDKVVGQLNKVDDKVTELRAQRMSDPDTLGDKAVKMALPSLIGMVAGKVFQSVWDTMMNKIHPSPDDDAKDRQNGIIMSMLFAAVSGAFGVLVTRGSDKGTDWLVHRLQLRREKKR